MIFRYPRLDGTARHPPGRHGASPAWTARYVAYLDGTARNDEAKRAVIDVAHRWRNKSQSCRLRSPLTRSLRVTRRKRCTRRSRSEYVAHARACVCASMCVLQRCVYLSYVWFTTPLRAPTYTRIAVLNITLHSVADIERDSTGKYRLLWWAARRRPVWRGVQGPLHAC